jgi:hypothetical protein
MVDSTNFMTKFVDGLIVFAIVFAYLWIVWQIIRFYVYAFKLIFKGIILGTALLYTASVCGS